jgi:ADP-ribosyltransferase exoenzyme
MNLIPNFESFCSGLERPDLDVLAQRLDTHYSLQRINLTHPERMSLELYKGMGYRDINRYMRSGNLAGANPQKLDDLDETIDLIRSALSKFFIPFPTVVYRGLKYGYPSANLAIGDYLGEQAFLSTTLSVLTAKQFCVWDANPAPSTILELSVPEGTKAIWLDGLLGKGEHELLLDSGTLIHISGIKVLQDYPQRRYLQCQCVQPT